MVSHGLGPLSLQAGEAKKRPLEVGRNANQVQAQQAVPAHRRQEMAMPSLGQGDGLIPAHPLQEEAKNGGL